ncbi:MAG: 30S ribosome-binding factor RbfA [Oscillospiraceae bacterium]|nr:30S ribosome-binding factor RbfA [Oscillospiraceae bacterium]
MPSYRANRIAEDMKRELIALIRDLKDPRLSGKLLTVVRVAVSGDGSSAKIYISAMEGLESAREAAKGLQNAAGLLRGELGRRLRLRKAPELRFIGDDSIAAGTEIARKIAELVITDDEEDSGNEN